MTKNSSLYQTTINVDSNIYDLVIYELSKMNILTLEGETYLFDKFITDEDEVGEKKLTSLSFSRKLIFYQELSTPNPEFINQLSHRISELEKNFSQFTEIKIENHSISCKKETRTDWKDSYKKYLKPVTVKPFTMIPIDPEMTPLPENPTQYEIFIKPGLAFGIGNHETTRLCSEYLIRKLKHNTPQSMPQSMLDVGTGTAILSILAERLGVQSISSIDIDEQALENASQNLELNQCKRINLSSTPIHEISDKFDLIISNIVFRVHSDLKEEYYKRINKNGSLFIAGILNEQKDELITEFKTLGFNPVDEIQINDWVGVEFILKSEIT